MEETMENTFDLEREREELLSFINERAEAAIWRALSLVPDEPRSETVTASTSTEGTGYAREE